MQYYIIVLIVQQHATHILSKVIFSFMLLEENILEVMCNSVFTTVARINFYLFAKDCI